MTSPPLPLRVAVVGLGPMGMHHVRAAADLVAAKLVAVADVDRARADDTARQFGCEALYDAAHLMGMVDAAIIATPPALHAATAIPLLNVGVPCLIEKPLAMTEADCAAIIAAATTAKTPVAVGHIERFNPATEALMAEGIDGAAIQSIDVKRFSPAGGRHVPVDVVSDMMIHDLEIVLALKRQQVTDVRASGAAESHAAATLTFADGTIATVAANRAAETRVRALTLATAQQTYTLDFMARQVTKADKGTTQPLAVTEHDALRAEISDFLSAAKTGQTPRVTPSAALDAMRVAWRVLDAMNGPRA